ncbi:MAG: DUF938 domain-containing protein [Burkholderiales bacterium]|nr:MAG: DUF938 domain-containing protein [Burkholderiales bacterium]
MSRNPGQMIRHTPAAERNRQPILEVLAAVLPESGLVLEVASGTGQHVEHFAAALPALQWQPSDPDPDARASIDARIRLAGLDNVRAAIALDVRRTPWPLEAADAIVCINMIHIAPWSAALALLDGAAAVLPPGGVLVLYGPYMRDGVHTAPSNARFDAYLRARDPQWGVRDLREVQAAAAAAGLALDRVLEMPANNLSVVFRKGSG